MSHYCVFCKKYTAKFESHDPWASIIKRESHLCPNCQKRTVRLFHYIGIIPNSYDYTEFTVEKVPWIRNDIYNYLMEQSLPAFQRKIAEWKQVRVEEWGMNWDQCLKHLKKIPITFFGEKGGG